MAIYYLEFFKILWICKTPIVFFLFPFLKTQALVIFFYSFYAVSEYIKDNKNKDPKEVVIDEFIGQSIPIYLYEVSHETIKNSQEAVLFYLYIFILFRYFDIKKPFPVSYFDKNFKNSFGVIMDDVCAGFYVVLSLICFMILSSYFI